MKRFLQRRFATKQNKSKIPPINDIDPNKFQKKLQIATNYRPVRNLDTIFDEIDDKLGVSGPPSIEYLYVVPIVSFSLNQLLFFKQIYSSSNPYGHSALRYTTSNGEQYVMNIVGKPGHRMVNFLTPKDYLFGDPSITCNLGSEQGGIFQRSIIGFRLENYPSHKIDELHEYFITLQKREEEKKEVSFNIFALPGWLRIPFFSKAYERGNCALWTSKGFVVADLFQKATIFPKYIFVKLYMKSINSYGWHGMYSINNKNKRCNIVAYNQLVCDDEDDDKQKKRINPSGWTTPFLFSSSNRNFRNLRTFAHCNVDLDGDVDDDGQVCYKAKIENCEPWRPKFLRIWDH